MSKTDYLKNLPKKRMASGILLFNKSGELLIVRPSYNNHWIIPGGVIEENESPRQGCIREVREEIGLNIEKIYFLCIDYKAGSKENSESLQFIFYGGILEEKQIASIKLQGKELSDYKFADIENALSLLTPSLAKRVEKSLEAIEKNNSIYMENNEH